MVRSCRKGRNSRKSPFVIKLRKENLRYLTSNNGSYKGQKRQGVKVLPSGLQYKVVAEGTGATPTVADRVKTHYRGVLIDGTEFDNSYKRGEPATFEVTGVMTGWTEALQLMKEGAK